MTSGNSIQEARNILSGCVNIVDIVVVLNRQEGFVSDFHIKSLFYKNDIIKYRLKNISSLKKI